MPGPLEEGPEPVAPPVPQFSVSRTKKGGYPIELEKRSGGKVVTIVRKISGDTEALLRVFRKLCAAGGKAGEDSIELQGDHRAKVETFLRKHAR
jgi:translation initiation factor 1 (eIF-1/SUI1)